MFGCGLEALLDVREALPDVREWSGASSGCPKVVGMSSQMSGSGQETLSDVREALPDVQE